MRNKHLSCTWVLLLNCINQLSLTEKKLFSICGLAFSFLLSCTKQSISVLRSSKLVILCIEALTWLALQKSSKTWNLSSALQITFNFMRKETSFMYLSFTLINCINQLSLTEKEAFQHLWPCFLFFCLVALNRALVFLEALN